MGYLLDGVSVGVDRYLGNLNDDEYTSETTRAAIGRIR